MHDRVAIRDQTLPADGLTVDQLDELGLRAIELQIDEDLKPVHLRGELDPESVRISALLLMTDFANDHVDWATRAIARATDLGAGVVRVDPLTAQKDLTAEQIAGNCIRSIEAILANTAGSNGRVPKSIDSISLTDPALAARPNIRPNRAGRSPSTSVSCRTCARLAPSAMRMPISAVRCATM